MRQHSDLQAKCDESNFKTDYTPNKHNQLYPLYDLSFIS